jgi:hypothetical protein
VLKSAILIVVATTVHPRWPRGFFNKIDVERT